MSQLALPTIFRAIQEHRMNTISMILKIEVINGVDIINSANEEGNTPLFIACYHGNIHAIIIFLQLGASPYKENLMGMSALTIAYNRNPHLVELLIKNF